MKLTRIEIFRYRLPLVQPLKLPGGSLSRREGLILRLGDEDGCSGLGEAAPFPGLHRERLEFVSEQLRQMAARIIEIEFPGQSPHWEDTFIHGFGPLALFPSLRFALETAVLNLLSQRRQKPLYRLLSLKSTSYVPVNALLSGSREEILSTARELRQQGYHSFKLKVGRKKLKEDISRVQALRRELGPEAEIRLDANRAWSLSDAVYFGKGVADYHIQYVEEPVKNSRDFGEFFVRTGLPFALDEALAEASPQNTQFPPGVRAFVLKPDVLGGWEKTVQFIRRAEAEHILPVISCSFLSGVGVAALAQMAAALVKEGVAAGLDTYRWLQEDVLRQRISLRKGRISCDEAWQKSSELREEFLEPVFAWPE